MRRFRMHMESASTLALCLQCSDKGKSKEWSYVAKATFKLKSNKEEHSIELELGPNVFSSEVASWCYYSVIQWESLFDPEKGYVNDDAIALDIKIKAVAPEDGNEARLIFNKIAGCCEEASLAAYRLTIKQVNSLMAVQSPTFRLQDKACTIQVSKDAFGFLGICFAAKNMPCELSCKVNFKLVSTKIFSKEQSKSKIKNSITWGISTENFIHWDQLAADENGFINDNSIVVEVEVKFDKMEKVIAAIKRSITPTTQTEAKVPRLNCSICNEGFEQQAISSTACGHLFCTACIVAAIKTNKACPKPNCTGRPTLKSLRHVSL